MTAEADFQRAYKTGRSGANRLLRVYYVARSEGPTRVAYVAGRRVGSAVARNRAKRMMREGSRDLVRLVGPAQDIVLVAHTAVLGARVSDVQAAVRQLFERAELVGVQK